MEQTLFGKNVKFPGKLGTNGIRLIGSKWNDSHLTQFHMQHFSGLGSSEIQRKELPLLDRITNRNPKIVLYKTVQVYVGLI